MTRAMWRNILTEAEFVALLKDKRLGWQKLRKAIGYSNAALRYWQRRYRISFMTGCHSAARDVDKQTWLKWIHQNLSYAEMARRLSCNVRTVKKYMKSLGISTAPTQWRRKIRNYQIQYLMRDKRQDGWKEFEELSGYSRVHAKRVYRKLWNSFKEDRYWKPILSYPYKELEEEQEALRMAKLAFKEETQ